MGSGFFSSWTFWALMSAVFAAKAAIFSKAGIENVNSDFATLLRTVVVLVSLALILYATGQYQSLGSISAKKRSIPAAVWSCHRCLVDLLFPGAQTWPGLAVAPVDKLSVVLVAVLGVILLESGSTCANGAELA